MNKLYSTSVKKFAPIKVEFFIQFEYEHVNNIEYISKLAFSINFHFYISINSLKLYNNMEMFIIIYIVNIFAV